MEQLIEPLLVPVGTQLAEGSLYLRLYHGRHDPEQDMEDWGFQGPVFGPLSSVTFTYLSTIRLHARDGYRELWLDTYCDMVQWSESYYGDFELFVANHNSTA